MADPIQITILGQLREQPLIPDPTATVEFIRPVFVRHTDGTVVEPGSQTVEVAADGSFTLPVMPTNQPGWGPQNWTYEIVIFDGARRHRFYGAVPYDVPGGEMPLPIPALSQSQGYAYAPINHLHEIEDVNDLQVQLEGLQPAGNYVTVEALGGMDLISYDTLQESLEDYLPKIQPIVTDSFFRVVRSAGGGAQWRTDGAALDIEFVGDVIESRRANQDFTGTQTDIRRVRANGNTLVGLTEFGSGPFAADQSVDSRVGQGVAALGAKNSALNHRICGYLDISTAPTTGTWEVGDVVLTKVGSFRCIGAGTPGVWIWLQSSEAMDSGFAGWMGPPRDIQGSLIMTAGIPYVFRFRADAPTISAMNLHLVTPGSGLTNAFWTLHNDDGSIVSPTAKSASQTANLQTGGERTMTIPTQNVTPGAFYRGRVWTTGTTQPTLSRRCSSSNAAINAGNQLWYSSAAGGLTDLASAPDNIGALSTTVPTVAWWAGWKP